MCMLQNDTSDAFIFAIAITKLSNKSNTVMQQTHIFINIINTVNTRCSATDGAEVS